MTWRRTLLLCAGAVGAALALRSATSEPEPPGARDPVVTLQREVAQLKQQAARPRVVALPGRPAEASAPAPQVDEPLEPARVAERLEARVAAEPTHLDAADALRRALGDALTAQTRIADVACGASLCRATLVHGDLAAQRELAPTIAGLPALRTGVFYSYVEGAEPPRTVLYVLAEGQDIGALL